MSVNRCFRVVGLMLLVPPAFAQDPPDGWRTPTTAELSGAERDVSSTRYASLEADFNGDARPDCAFLLKSTTSRSEALWVHLSVPDDGYTWLKLDEVIWEPEHSSVPLVMAIEIAPPGNHQYACFDGDDSRTCNFGHDRFILELRNPGITYFKFSRASSLFFWSTDQGGFRRAWTRD